MELIYWLGPGRPCSDSVNVTRDRQVALRALQHVLETTKGHLYKVGITSNPQFRTYGHEGVEVDRRQQDDMIYITVQKGLWSHMHVIYQTSSEASIRQAEREFIDSAVRTYGSAFRQDQKPGQSIFPFNVSSGGGGPLPPRGPYFLYVLRSLG